MKCSEAEALIDAFISSLPPIEHEFEHHVSSCSEYEHYMCKSCMEIVQVMKTKDSDGKLE